MGLNGPLGKAYDVVVVGSGFGGSVMASELAAATKKPTVCVLERGRAYPPGSFPRKVADVERNFWAPHHGLHGLYDVDSFQHIDAIVASGLGGGSLIYANVMLRKDPTWFQQRTPNGQSSESWVLGASDLAKHYDEVSKFLRVEPLPHDTEGETVPEDFHLDKTRQFLGLPTGSPDDERGYAPLAVRFHGDDGMPAVGVPFTAESYGNVHGEVQRRTCSLIGECDVGCNEGAKNSLDHTYLSRASFYGASIHTLTEVVRLRLAGEDDPHRFVVTARVYRDQSAEDGVDGVGYEDYEICAHRVVLAAGTLGSTRLLLQNAEALGLHSDAEPNGALGTRFCGNGDFLAAVRGATEPLNASRGPVITAYRRYPAETDPRETETRGHDSGGDGGGEYRHGMYIEDAGYPNFATWNRQGLLPGLTDAEVAETVSTEGLIAKVWTERMAEGIRDNVDAQAGSDVQAVRQRWTFTRHFMPLLGMGRDQPDGTLSLDDDGRLRCDWSAGSSEAYFAAMNDRMADIAEELGGEFVSNPLYDWFDRVITVHPVGGCPMDTHEEKGVVDTYGRVRGVPGLRVCDGSVFPGPIGPNPSLTIAAFARRSAEQLVQEAGFRGPPAEADPWVGG